MNLPASLPPSLLDAQTQALLRRLAREQESRIQRIRDEAEARAAEIVHKARKEARVRVRQAVLDMRRDDELSLARKRAALDTQERQRRQTMLRDWLEHAWLELPAALQARWLEPHERERWCMAALDAARRDLLQHDPMHVEVSPRWVAAVEPIVLRRTADDAAVTVDAVDGLQDGLRIRAGHACVDATVAGLLAPQQRIAAELLAEFLQRSTTRRDPGAAG